MGVILDPNIHTTAETSEKKLNLRKHHTRCSLWQATDQTKLAEHLCLRFPINLYAIKLQKLQLKTN